MLFKRTLHILLEGAPAGADTVDITAHLLKTVDGIEKISHVHVWLITSGRALATLHSTQGGRRYSGCGQTGGA